MVSNDGTYTAHLCNKPANRIQTWQHRWFWSRSKKSGAGRRIEENKCFEKAFAEGEVVGTKTTQFGEIITKRVQVSEQGALDVGFIFEEGSLPKVTTIIPKLR